MILSHKVGYKYLCLNRQFIILYPQDHKILFLTMPKYKILLYIKISLFP